VPTIPANQLIHAEIVSAGTIAAAGGTAKSVVNVYQFRRTSVVNVVVKAHIEAAFQTAIMVPVTDALNARFTQTGNSVRFLNDATDAPETVARAVVGAIAGESLPTFETAVLQMKTTYRGKSGRGNKHYAPIAESAANGDTLTAGSLVLFNLVKTAILAGFTDSDGNVWKTCIVSKGAIPPLSQLTANPTTVFANDVSSAIMNKTTGTMRRRKVKTVT